MHTRKETISNIDFYRVNNDTNMNPRYVFHFLELDTDYNKAHKKALSIGAKIYRGKWFGGGFVIHSYNLIDTAKKIRMLKIITG